MTVSSLPDALEGAIERLSTAARAGGATVAVAESLTSGAVASAIGRGESASEWFAGGVVAYLMRVKEAVLGVRPGIDPCSAECAEQLARGVRERLDAEVAVSTTGVGGPDPEDGHPAGTVFIGWATADEVGHRFLQIDGPPEDVVEETVEAAVSLLADLTEKSN